MSKSSFFTESGRITWGLLFVKQTNFYVHGDQYSYHYAVMSSLKFPSLSGSYAVSCPGAWIKCPRRRGQGTWPREGHSPGASGPRWGPKTPSLQMSRAYSRHVLDDRQGSIKGPSALKVFIRDPLQEEQSGREPQSRPRSGAKWLRHLLPVPNLRGAHNSIIKIKKVFMQYFLKSQYQKVNNEQNARILKKDRTDITDLSFFLRLWHGFTQYYWVCE